MTVPATALGPRRPSAEKLRGAFYTPDAVAAFLAGWAVTSPRSRVLEPSAGDGAFARAVSPLLSPPGRLDAVELAPDDAAKLASLGLPNVRVIAADVFAWYGGGRYDAVVGNPPFIRYQAFNGDRRRHAFALMGDAGLRPSRLTNAWVPFVVLAVRALRPGGRVALVVPAELTAVSYAGPLREWLATELSDLHLVTFRRLLFGPVQQETLLLMGERGPGRTPATTRLVAVDEPRELADEVLARAAPVPLPAGRAKWTRLWLSSRQRGLLEEVERSGAFPRLGTLAEVDVGIVTGANHFFVLRPSQAHDLGLEPWCRRLVARSAQLPETALTAAAWRSLAGADEPCLLLQLGPVARDDMPAAGLAYVANGEQAGIHTGYKCRIRMPSWWHVPSMWAPDAFLLRQIHTAPRIVANPAGAVCTDTIHRVRARPGVDPAWLARASDNPLTWAFAEVLGRSYGGGVLELEPTEAEALPFPPAGGEGLAGAGLGRSEIDCLRGIWQELSTRRTSRRRRPRMET